MMSGIFYLTGNEKLLDEIKELWEGLNLIHLEKSSNFKNHYAANTFEKRKEVLLSKANKGSIFVVLAQDKQKNIGYCVSTVNDGVGEIESIFIHSSYRKLGIGNQLMQKSLDWIEKNHPKKVIVTVSVGNEEAFSFYQRFGLYPRVTQLEMIK